MADAASSTSSPETRRTRVLVDRHRRGTHRVGREKAARLASVDARKVARLRALTEPGRQRGRLDSRVRIDVVAITLSAQALRQWPDVGRADVDVRTLGAHAVWLRGVQ